MRVQNRGCFKSNAYTHAVCFFVVAMVGTVLRHLICNKRSS